jgi:transposase-like protein
MRRRGQEGRSDATDQTVSALSQVGMSAAARCAQWHAERNGTLSGHQRYHCLACGAWFDETQGTPLYRLRTPVAEIAQALLLVMRRSSLRAAEEVTETIGHWLHVSAQHAEALTAVLVHDLHLSTVEIDETLAELMVRQTQAGSAGQALAWCSDGWRPYPSVIRQVYRQPVRTGRRGRPALRVPTGVALTQTIKHRDLHGHLLCVETRAAVGAAAAQPALVHVERRNGVCRDRVNALTRKTHAFAKSDATWDALLGLADHLWSWEEFLTRPVPVSP